ncbi:MAG: hypothetical protein J0L92_12335 [Deltaproteobacteria bacterium]|nr:hypothetical protein [Deltaproteobacteria bacterium]
MQDEGPFSDEAPPTEEELAAARALAAELDGAGDPTRGSLAELARRARATTHDQPPLSADVVRRGVEAGLAKKRTAQRRVAFVSFAAAAIAVIGFVALASPFTSRDVVESDLPSPTVGPPELTGLPSAPFPDGQRTSDRLDRMARLASEDWLAEQIAREGRQAAR